MVGALVVAGLGLLAYDAASDARASLLAGEARMDRGKELLLEGEVAAARAELAAALTKFRSASDAARSPILRALGWTPWLGRTPDTIREVTRAAETVARAAVTLADAVRKLPGGLDALAPEDGRLPLEAYAGLAPAVSTAHRLVADARAAVAATPRTLLLGPVGPARRDALEQLVELERSFATTATLLERLPEALGGGEPRRYLIGAQNPAELRGTGGLVGAYSIATVEDGRFDFGSFRPIQDLPNLDLDRVEPPSDEYAENYDRFGGAGFWLNANMTPDFPSAARAMLASYEVVTGERLDGVIYADPFALEALLEVTGPVEVPRLGIDVDAGSVVRFVSNEAYAQIRDTETRKVVLGAVAEQAFSRFMERGDAGIEALRTLADTAGGGHVLVFSRDDALQRALGSSNVGGSFGEPGEGDAIALILNNAGANKVDYYLERSIDYRVRLADEGGASATAAMIFENGAPSEGPPRYVIGPYEDISAAGENVAIANVYCMGCRLREVIRDGERAEVVPGAEGGLRFFQQVLRVPSGERTTLAYDWTLEEAWREEGAGGTYRLRYLGQPTIRPTRLRVEVAPPPGTTIAGSDPQMRIDDGRAVWEGVPDHRQTFVVRFERPWYARIWRSILRWFTRPVVRL